VATWIFPVAIQSYLAKIGIQANLELKDSANYTATIQGTWVMPGSEYPSGVAELQ